MKCSWTRNKKYVKETSKVHDVNTMTSTTTIMVSGMGFANEDLKWKGYS